MKGRLAAIFASTAIALASAAAVAPAQGAAAGGKLTVSPARNTPDVSPDTQISILGVPKGQIKKVTLTGSASGAHPGVLKAYSGKRGASFLPSEPLSQGESASVSIQVKGRQAIKYSFTVATLGPKLPALFIPIEQPDKLRHYTTLPDLRPPKISVLKNSSKTSGDIFMGPVPSPVVHPESDNAISIHPVGPGGPMIVGPKGNVVWFKQLEQPDYAMNLRIQKYMGKKVLTWWQGTVTPSAYGAGEGIIANSSYRTIATVEAGNGYSMDLHEFQLTPSGDALFTIYQPIKVHLPGTPDGTLSPLLDAIVQEVDVRTGLVTWEWHSYGHIPLSETYADPIANPGYDAFHINAIQELNDGSVLLSARDTSAVYKVDHTSGKIEWTLGGKASDFKMKGASSFWLQHDVHMQSNGQITMYDDQAGPPMKLPSSRGLRLKLDYKHHTAKVAGSYQRPENVSSQSEGSYQRRSTGNIFLGFGSEPYFSEFSPKGKLLYDAKLPDDDGTYRTFRYGWKGMPKTSPIAVAKTGDTGTSVYVSWNGATKVRTWQLLAGDAGGSLTPIAKSQKHGFETRIEVSGSYSRFRVRALDPKGRVLAKSAVVTPS